MKKLDKERAQKWWVEQLQQPLDENRQRQLDAYLNEHPQEAAEFAADASLWESLGKLDTPSPSTEMDMKFEAMLQEHQLQYAESSRQKPANFANWQVGIAAAIAGVIIGFFLIPKPGSEVDQLTAEVQDMKKMLMLTMIEKPQAQERIKAVNMVSQTPKNDDKIINALLTTLENDPSVNVRLAALEALINYGDQALVRRRLVESIAKQESPLMQVALADAMIVLEEKSASEPLQKLLDNEQVDKMVKTKIESTLKTLKSI